MLAASKIKKLIFDEEISFQTKVNAIYNYQYQHELTYQKFSQQLYPEFKGNADINDYPFLPIDFFRRVPIISKDLNASKVFESSGTTDSNNSQHHIVDLDLYEESILKTFQYFYGDPSDYIFYGLLPSYIDRSNASLLYMVEYLIGQSKQKEGGFYKFNYDELVADLSNYSGNKKKIVIGVTFALWEMAEQFTSLDWSDIIIMETGGMKGRKKEILREELHQILGNAFQVDQIHSEYGMTELLSMAYSKGNGVFDCPPWMKVLVRDPYDPKVVSTSGKGVINVIDLSNLFSCSFIATNDLGEVFEDGSFKVLGRMDNSQLRGCNLMFSD
ncbi:MAG: acyl transferase [Chitinophagales bacterium]